MRSTSRLSGTQRTRSALWAAGLVISFALAAPALAVHWEDMAGVQTVTITTTNADGSPRETTIWLVVVERVPYIRTGSTRWGSNVERIPDVTLRVGERDFYLRASPVTDPSLSEQIRRTFREKYGWEDRLVGLLPSAGTKLFRLDEVSGY